MPQLLTQKEKDTRKIKARLFPKKDNWAFIEVDYSFYEATLLNAFGIEKDINGKAWDKRDIEETEHEVISTKINGNSRTSRRNNTERIGPSQKKNP